MEAVLARVSGLPTQSSLFSWFMNPLFTEYAVGEWMTQL